MKSFFKGGGARVLRSSPQFGFTLAAYELLKNVFQLPYLEEKESKIEHEKRGYLFDLDEVPSITSQVTALVNKTKYYPSYSESHSNIRDFFNSTFNLYNSNYLNYYYKSCRVAKIFIDLDTSFSKFDYNAYMKLHKKLIDLNKK